jgi:deazaflavin-dependent oxidoreductase (nitroreductase family)
VTDNGPTPDLDLSLFGADHVRQYRETDGAVGSIWNGVPCLILTTEGRTSGLKRDTPLICGTDGGRYIVIASQGGAPTHPQWYLNLCADAQVNVQVQADRFDAVARTAESEERERLWQVMANVWPSYNNYQERTDRVIPVVVLERTR